MLALLEHKVRAKYTGTRKQDKTRLVWVLSSRKENKERERARLGGRGGGGGESTGCGQYFSCTVREDPVVVACCWVSGALLARLRCSCRAAFISRCGSGVFTDFLRLVHRTKEDSGFLRAAKFRQHWGAAAKTIACTLVYYTLYSFVYRALEAPLDSRESRARTRPTLSFRPIINPKNVGYCQEFFFLFLFIITMSHFFFVKYTSLALFFLAGSFFRPAGKIICINNPKRARSFISIFKVLKPHQFCVSSGWDVVSKISINTRNLY